MIFFSINVFKHKMLPLLLMVLATFAVAIPPFRAQQAIPGLSLPSNTTAIAGGSVPNSSLPPNVTSTTLSGFQVANYLENLEAAFFSMGLQNLSTIWDISAYPAYTLTMVSKVVAQEKVHVATIETLLTSFNASTIVPCQYAFPAIDASSFFALASIITTVGLGAVNGLTSSIASTDPLLIPSTASILSVESRHDAFFRSAGAGLVPNPAPFDTRLSPTFAYNLALPFVIPGSCSNILPLPQLPSLTINTSLNGSSAGTISLPNATASPLTQVTFTYDAELVEAAWVADRPIFLGWLNQANKPAFVQINVTEPGTATAPVPQGISGMAFVVLTGDDSAQDVDQLTQCTIAGPAVVVVS